MTPIAAVLFSVFTLITIGFQLALAAGMPWGEYAMGGKYPGRLPPVARMMAVLQAGVLGLLALVVLNHGGLIESTNPMSPLLIWVVVAFSAVNLLMNAVTPSPRERKIWAPVTLVLLATSLTVALGL